MKTFMLALIISLFTLQGVFSLTNTVRIDDDKYCAKLRDGKLTMMHNGSVLTANVTLTNGTQIKTDGSIVKPDGATVVLKEGECVDKDGISEEKKPKKSLGK
jgi:hypothetical protein